MLTAEKAYSKKCSLKKRTVNKLSAADCRQTINQVVLRRKRRILFFRRHVRRKNTLQAKNRLIQRFFKDTGVVLAGIECSPKISDFRANGIPVQESVDFVDTLKRTVNKLSAVFICFLKFLYL